MKEVDVLVVGLGLAGVAYIETLQRHDKSFHVFDQSSSGSSAIAAGIYNPTVLKRFNMTWKGDEFHRFSLPFYAQIARRLNTVIDHPSPIHKLFNNQAEHNQWMVAADRPDLSNFLLPAINKNLLNGVNTPHGYASLQHCGRINTSKLIAAYKASIQSSLSEETFDYAALESGEDHVLYKGFKANYIVFCEGYAMVNNPYFKQLPLVGSKGQILIIKAPELKSLAILKGPIFIAPLGDDLYWAGASFEQQDKTLEITEKGKLWLRDKIAKMISVPFTIEKHLTHIRPTVKDRRPLLGAHETHPNIYLFNGMGSRGVLTAPLAAKWLFSSIEEGSALMEEVHIDRFKK